MKGGSSSNLGSKAVLDLQMLEYLFLDALKCKSKQIRKGRILYETALP